MWCSKAQVQTKTSSVRQKVKFEKVKDDAISINRGKKFDHHYSMYTPSMAKSSKQFYKNKNNKNNKKNNLRRKVEL